MTFCSLQSLGGAVHYVLLLLGLDQLLPHLPSISVLVSVEEVGDHGGAPDRPY